MEPAQGDLQDDVINPRLITRLDTEDEYGERPGNRHYILLETHFTCIVFSYY